MNVKRLALTSLLSLSFSSPILFATEDTHPSEDTQRTDDMSSRPSREGTNSEYDDPQAVEKRTEELEEVPVIQEDYVAPPQDEVYYEE